MLTFTLPFLHKPAELPLDREDKGIEWIGKRDYVVFIDPTHCDHPLRIGYVVDTNPDAQYALVEWWQRGQYSNTAFTKETWVSVEDMTLLSQWRARYAATFAAANANARTRAVKAS